MTGIINRVTRLVAIVAALAPTKPTPLVPSSAPAGQSVFLPSSPPTSSSPPTLSPQPTSGPAALTSEEGFERSKQQAQQQQPAQHQQPAQQPQRLPANTPFPCCEEETGKREREHHPRQRLNFDGPAYVPHDASYDQATRALVKSVWPRAKAADDITGVTNKWTVLQKLQQIQSFVIGQIPYD